MTMRVGAGLHEVFARIGRASWETRIALAVPLLIGLLAIPVLLGAFASAAPGDNPGGGYGGPPSTLPVRSRSPRRHRRRAARPTLARRSAGSRHARDRVA